MSRVDDHTELSVPPGLQVPSATHPLLLVPASSKATKLQCISELLDRFRKTLIWISVVLDVRRCVDASSLHTTSNLSPAAGGEFILNKGSNQRTGDKNTQTHTDTHTAL